MYCRRGQRRFYLRHLQHLLLAFITGCDCCHAVVSLAETYFRLAPSKKGIGCETLILFLKLNWAASYSLGLLKSNPGSFKVTVEVK